MKKYSYSGTGTAIILFLIIIAAFSSKLTGNTKNKSVSENKTIDKLQDEIYELQSSIDDADEFMSKFEDRDAYVVDEDFMSAVYDILSAEETDELDVAIKKLQDASYGHTMEDYHEYIPYDDIPYIGEEATFEAAGLTEDLSNMLND